MRPGAYSLFPLAVLALLAALTFWLDHATRFDDTKRDGKNRHDPDFVIEKVVGRKYGPDGKLLEVLLADRMTHFPDNDTTEVVNPDMTYLRNEPPLHLRSRFGILGKDAQVADLRDNVFGWRDAAADAPAMTFSSSQLTVYPDQEIARTDVPVKFTRGKSVMTGVGMDLDNKLQILSLHSQVKGSFEPRKH